MAEKARPSKQEPAAQPITSGGIGDAIRAGLGPDAATALAQMAGRWQIPAFQDAVDAYRVQHTGSADERDLRPEIAGGASSGEPSPKRIRSTRTKHRPGVLRVKEYPITEDTMDNIGTLRVSAAFWFAVGSLALGFALSSWQSLSLAGSGIDAAAKATWSAYRDIGAVVAIVAYLAGAFYFWKGKSVIQFVKDNTIHDPIE